MTTYSISARRVWRSFLSHFVWMGIGLALIGASIASEGRQEDTVITLAFLGSLVVVVSAILVLYERFSNHYYVEDNRIEHRRGIIAKDIDSIRLQDLRNINLRQSVWQRMLLMGHLQFSSAGGDGIEVRWRNVGQPTKLKAQIEAMQ